MSCWCCCREKKPPQIVYYPEVQLPETDDEEETDNEFGQLHRTPSSPTNKTFVVQYEYMDLRKGDKLEAIEVLEEDDSELQSWIGVRNLSTGTITRAPVPYLAEITDVNEEPWYFGEVQDKIQAEIILLNATPEDGLFLVRNCASNPKVAYSLSVKRLDQVTEKYNVVHYHIFKQGELYGMEGKETFVTVKKLIETYLERANDFLGKPCPKERQLEIDRNKLEIESGEIGKGAFGVVRKAHWNNRAIAIKELQMTNDTTIREFMKEIQLMNQYKHKNIVILYGVCTDVAPYLMIIEYMENGALLEYIKETSLSLEQNLKIIEQIADGMAFLEMYKVIHRDLAARNILLSADLTAKIADFGLSRKLTDERYVMQTKTMLPILWLSVESLGQGIFTTKSDVWAFGILAMEIFTRGARPYSEYKIPGNEIYGEILHKGKRMTRPKDVPVEIFDKIASCWRVEPDERPTFAKLVKYFSNIEIQITEENAL